jgi:gamma-glutamyltranspeptidase/glutathione hydrolase
MLDRSPERRTSPTVEGEHGVVCTPDDRATAAGLQVLKDGGNATDAAVCASAVLAVVAQHMCGMGGDLVAVVADGDPTLEPEAVLATGLAGSGASSSAMRAEGLTMMPPTGDIRTVTVPGCVDGWLAMHVRRGRLPLERVLAPAVELATSGFAVSPLLASGLTRVGRVRGAEDLTGEGIPVAGDVRRRPRLAESLSAIGRDGRDAWYGGGFGASLVELGGGLFTSDDLAESCAAWVPTATISTSYGRLFTVPAPSQGYITLLAAAILDELQQEARDDAWPHLQIESFRAAGHDRAARLGDGIDVGPLLDRAEVVRRAALIDRRATSPWPAAPAVGDTVGVTVIDADGSAVALTQSNSSGFGARIVEPTTGVWLHNRGTGFSLEEGAPNALRPRTRPVSTLAPLVLRSNDATSVTAIATRGGDTQPQILLQLLEGLVGGGSPGDVLSGPRWMLGSVGHGAFDVWRPGPDGVLRQTVRLEEGAPDAWRYALESARHTVADLPWGGSFGHAQIATRDPDGRLSGGSDPRALTGAALAW